MHVYLICMYLWNNISEDEWNISSEHECIWSKHPLNKYVAGWQLHQRGFVDLILSVQIRNSADWWPKIEQVTWKKGPFLDNLLNLTLLPKTSWSFLACGFFPFSTPDRFWIQPHSNIMMSCPGWWSFNNETGHGCFLLHVLFLDMYRTLTSVVCLENNGGRNRWGCELESWNLSNGNNNHYHHFHTVNPRLINP